MQGVFVHLTAPDSNSVFYRIDKNFSITDFSGSGRLNDHFDGLRDLVIGEDDFDANLG